MSEPPATLVNLLLEMLSVRSVIDAETAMADFMERRLQTRLSDVRRIGNAIVAFGPRRGRPLLALVGHLDTVLNAPDDINTPRIEGGRVHGLGASDMKAALACDLWLLENYDITKSPFDLCWVLYDCEEGPIANNGLIKLWDAVPELSQIDLAICGEPTDNAVQLGCMGTMQVTVTFRGKAAHSARPWHGDNAIHKAGALLSALGALAPRDVVIDGMLFREVVSATLANGGRSRNVVPDNFELNINARFSAETTPESVFANITKMAAGADCRVTDCAPAAPPRRSHPLVEKMITQLGARVEPKQAWTDVAQFAGRGIAAINFGPGEQAQAHQRDESILLTNLAEGMRARETFLLSK